MAIGDVFDDSGYQRVPPAVAGGSRCRRDVLAHALRVPTVSVHDELAYQTKQVAGVLARIDTPGQRPPERQCIHPITIRRERHWGWCVCTTTRNSFTQSRPATRSAQCWRGVRRCGELVVGEVELVGLSEVLFQAFGDGEDDVIVPSWSGHLHCQSQACGGIESGWNTDRRPPRQALGEGGDVVVATEISMKWCHVGNDRADHHVEGGGRPGQSTGEPVPVA